LIKKISDKDKQDWQDFIDSSDKLENKDNLNIKDPKSYAEKSIDLHGYSLDEANQKMTSYINECFEKGINKINVITGKGLRSKNLNDPYQSKNLSILKHSVPNFIKGNNQLMSKIINIDFEAVENPSIGNFDIFLKRKK
tara:strand:+ start:1982 stop:2398 length:417 start_codon:yes stop_codon:yes gene_type:complete